MSLIEFYRHHCIALDADEIGALSLQLRDDIDGSNVRISKLSWQRVNNFDKQLPVFSSGYSAPRLRRDMSDEQSHCF